MPDLRQTIVLKVESKDVDRVIKDLKTMDVQIDRTEKSGGRVSGRLSEIGGAAKRWIAGIATAAFAAMATAVLKATKAAIDFERGMAEVGTLVDNATVNLKGLGDGLLDIARRVPESIGTLTSALYQTVSAGVDAGEALGIVEQAARSAKAGATDTRTAVDGLTTVLNAFSLSTQEAEKVSDAFFVAVRDGKTTFGELAASIGQVAPIAAQLGVSYEEVLAATAALTKAGVNTSEAMTQIRSALVAVAKQTTESQKAASKLGIEFNQSALAAKGFQQFITDVTRAADGNSEVLVDLFGRIEGVSAAMALGGAQADDFAATLGNMTTRAGSTEEAFDEMMNTVRGLWDVIKSKLSVAMIEFGQHVLPVVMRALEGVNKLMRVFESDVETVARKLRELGVGGMRQLRADLDVEIKHTEDLLEDAADRLTNALTRQVKGLGIPAEGIIPSEVMGRIRDAAELGVDALLALRKEFQGNAQDAAALGKILASDEWENYVDRIDAAVEATRDQATFSALLAEKQEQLKRVTDSLNRGITSFRDSVADTTNGYRKAVVAAEQSAKSQQEFAAVVVVAQEKAVRRLNELVESGVIDRKAFDQAKKNFADFGDEAIKAFGQKATRAAEQLTKEQLKQIDAAKKYFAALEQALQAQKFLKNLTAEQREFGADLLELQKQIAQAKEMEAALGERLTDAQRAQTAELERQRDELQKQLKDYDQAVDALKLLGQGAGSFAEAILTALDPKAIEAAMQTIVRTMEEDIRLAELKPEIDFEATKAKWTETLQVLLDATSAIRPQMRDVIVGILGEALDRLKPETKELAKGIVDNFRESLSRASRDLDLGGSMKDFRKQAESAFDLAIRQLDSMRGESKELDAALDDVEKTLRAILQAALEGAGAFSLFAANAQAVADIVDEVGNLSDALGMVSDETQKAIRNFAGLIRSAGNLAGAIGQIKSATSVFGVLGGVGAAIGAGTGILSSLGGFLSSTGILGFGRGERERQQIEAALENNRRLEEIRQRIEDNTRRITEKIEDLIGATIAPDVTRQEAADLRGALDKFIADQTRFWDALRSGEGIVIGMGPEGPIREFDPQVIMRMMQESADAFFDALRASGVFEAGFIDQLEQQFIDMGRNIPDFLAFLESSGFMDTVDEITSAWGEFSSSLDGAAERLRFFQRFLGDGKAALQDFARTLLDSDMAADLPENIRQLLEDLVSGVIDIDTAEGQAAFNAALTGIAELFAETGSAALGNLSFEDWQEILSLLSGFRDDGEVGRSFEAALSRAAQAARDFAAFVDAEDVQGAFDAWRRAFIAAAGEDIPDGLAAFLTGLGTIDIESEEGQRQLRDMIRNFGDELVTGFGPFMEALGLTEDEFRQLLETLTGFVIPEIAPPEGADDVLSTALRDLGLELDVLGSDVTDALRRFIDKILEGTDELDDDLASILEQAKTLDLSTEEGRRRMQRLITQLTQGIIGGVFGGDEGTAEDILRVLQDMLGRSEQTDDEFSRSVQIARTITEIQANELITIVNTISHFVKRIYDFIVRNPVRETAGPPLSDVATTGPTEITATVDATGLVAFSESLEDILRNIDMHPQPRGTESFFAQQSSITNEFDIDIRTEQSIDRIMQELDQEVRERLYDAFRARR